METAVAVKIVTSNTPVELYKVGGKKLYVKREDLSAVSPGPSFSKTRGLRKTIIESGAKVIGCLDTYHSWGGWATAYICHVLKKKAIIFYPKFKADKKLRLGQRKAKKFKAELIPLKAGRSSILYHQAKKILASKYKSSYMIPNALKLDATVTETAQEVSITPKKLLKGTVVISISSATVASGVIKGLSMLKVRPRIILHLGYTRSTKQVLNYVRSMSGVEDLKNVEVIDEGYAYRDAVNVSCPFPSNEYYDRKAFKWVCENIKTLDEPVLFWNIG
jgi:hypothetical protein